MQLRTLSSEDVHDCADHKCFDVGSDGLVVLLRHRKHRIHQRRRRVRVPLLFRLAQPPAKQPHRSEDSVQIWRDA